MKKLKVHIVYNSKEYERITNPILEDKPSKVYYFFHHGENEDINLDCKEENIRVIKENLPNCTIIEGTVNYVDYYDIISKLAGIISNERDAEITINLGTGSKMVAVANLDAYRLWDLKLIYPYSLDYDPSNKSTHHGEIINAELPKFEFKTPPIKLIKAMQLIYWMLKHDPHGRDITQIRQLDLQEKLYQSLNLEQVKFNPDSRKKDSSQKMKLYRNYIQPLEDEWGLIATEKSGRAKFISFTDKGLKMIRVLMNYDYGLKLPND